MGKKKKTTILASLAGDDQEEVMEVIEVPVLEAKPEIQEQEEKKVEIPTYTVGDIVRLTPEATFASGGDIPDAFFAMKLYIKGYTAKGNVEVAVSRGQSHFGIVPPEMLEIIPDEELAAAAAPVPEIEPYLVKIVVKGAEVKAGASHKYKTVTTYSKDSIYTIIAERNGYGRLKNGKGWINLADVVKLKV